MTSQTYDFVPEIWNEIKEYAGIYPLPANIIHFDKLTWDELEDSIEGWYEVPTPFENICVGSVYELLGEKEGLERAGDKYYYDGGEIKGKYKKELLVNLLKIYYREADHIHGKGNIQEKVEFWNEVSEMITYHFQKRDVKKAAAAWGRKKNKEFKETVKGMTQEIIKMEGEERKLVARMEKDAEKLKILKAKRGKLEKKREERYGD
tara:strand:- start:8 stop:625 length:618 start_codon:yes stop_codon:yes gene_type:complete